MDAAPFGSEEIREWTAGWWMFVVVGLLSIAAGVIVLAKPDDSLATIAVVSGIFLLVDGIFGVVFSFSRATENRGLAALLGVLGVIAGTLLIRHPIAGVAAVALLVGIWLIAAGVVRFALAFDELEHRGWKIAAAAVEAIAGIVIVASPGIGFATLALLVGISFLVNGVAMVALGWRMRAARREATAASPRMRAAH